MTKVKDYQLDIAASIFMLPCTEKELMERDFCKDISIYLIQRMIFWLENDGAIYYKGDIMYVRRKWAKENLHGYELDFRTKKEKYIDSLTPFAKKVYGL